MRRSRKHFEELKTRMHGMKNDFKDDVRDEWDDWRDGHRDRRGRRHSRSRFYLDKENALLFGVCAGIADYTGLDRFWVRAAFLAAVLFGLPFAIIGYFAVAFIADYKPREFRNEQPQEQEFWRNVRTKPHTTVRDVRLRFKDMERRLRDMERYVTSGTRKLDQEINALRD